jgi:hypothetical protein
MPACRRDLAVKFTDYFRHPGVQHYLTVVLENRTAIQHSRGEGSILTSRIAGIGDRLTFGLPRISVAVADLFGDLGTVALQMSEPKGLRGGRSSGAQSVQICFKLDFLQLGEQ